MVAYQDFVALSRSQDSEDRGQAAHLAALAYLNHSGPTDEHAALYAALIGFLDDPSVKVRAALAYGMLHAREAPRPILLALLRDSPVIARAVAQYSPALIDADLMALIAATADDTILLAIAMRERISERVATALVGKGSRVVLMKLVDRHDVPLSADLIDQLTERARGDDAELRGALLGRPDLSATARLKLVEAVAAALRGSRLIVGAVAPERLERIVRDATDTALTGIGEDEASAGLGHYAVAMVGSDRVSTRVMLHAVVHGHVLFFAACIGELAELPRNKVLTILESGSRPALNALLARCGLNPATRNLIARLVFHARTSDLADDVAARHYVVTALTEELIADHQGVIPPEIEEAFTYLSEQNVILARRAARGVMAAFAGESEAQMSLPRLAHDVEPLALPAA